MDYKRIVANYHYLNGNGCIKIWNRASLEQEIVITVLNYYISSIYNLNISYMQVIETYMHAVCLHLSSNFLFASFSDGKIKIWNAKLGELVLKFPYSKILRIRLFIRLTIITIATHCFRYNNNRHKIINFQLNSLKNDVEGVVENMCFVDGILVTLSPEPQGVIFFP